MKNTEYNIQAIDLIAMMETFEKMNIPCQNKGNFLYFEVSRYAMDEHGYYVGYEKYVGRLTILNKKDLGITGIPLSIFPKVVIVQTLQVWKNIGAIKKSKTYSKPDDDFAFQELEYTLKKVIEELEEAEFDYEKREWSCGYFEQHIN